MRLAIGDIHGRNFWKHYLDEDFSAYYMLGDYFDSYNLPFDVQYHNFIEICDAAKMDSRIKLCLGNHDYHYLGNIGFQRYSGYQKLNARRIRHILETNITLLQIVHVTEDRFILSHAGVSRRFMDKLGLGRIEEINDGFTVNREILSFDGNDIYGDNITQSPLWIRPRSLMKDCVCGYSQIVGHTQCASITEVLLQTRDAADNPRKLVFIDTGEEESIYRF
ncbi:MAG: metallophosphoesterase [Treponema sp.]|jgi:hypothetical protein|nr:metallophosphoesterase [Treponema sp.]